VRRDVVALVGGLLIVVVAISAFYASNMGAPAASTTTGRIKVLASFYPVYDFANNVGGSRIDLLLLVPETDDVHSFEPRPSSIQNVATANVLIYSGAGLEPWIPQIVAAADNPRLIVVDSSQGIPLLPVPPRFQKDNRAFDPHIWLDPVLAKQQVMNILQGLIRADPADQGYFTSNAQAYTAKLDNLNSEILQATSNVKTRYFITFHEAFAYFAKKYNLTQIPITGPFEEEPSPSDIQTVITAIQQNHLCYVGYESLENPSVSQSVASQTHATLVLMDPIEGLSQADQAVGKTYLIKMQDNLAVFVLALNHADC
jgi:zinc transport system substrate-binding protein